MHLKKSSLFNALDLFENKSTNIIRKGTKKLKYKLGYIDFPKRIRDRYKIVHQPGNYEHLMNIEMCATDPLYKWQDDTNWRFKLDDKYNSREFAKMHGSKVPDLYWKGKDVDSIDFDALPENFVIKPKRGHSAVGTMVFKNYVNLFDNKKYEPCEIKAILSKFLKSDYYFVKDVLGHTTNYVLENQEFLIEEFVGDENGVIRIPDDYKFFSFNGHVACIKIINRISPKEGYTLFYDEFWNVIPDVQPGNYSKAKYQPPPLCFEEMIEKVKLLSKAYKRFVRIDFYATDKGAVFGEFTPTPAMGNGYTPYGVQLLNTFWDRYCADEI
jgi:hypothetical protein